MTNHFCFLTSLEKLLQKKLDEQNLDPNKINDYFASPAGEMEKWFESPVDHLDVETNEKTNFLPLADQAEILKLLDNCWKSNVEGYNFMRDQLLSLAAPVFAQPVTYSTNWCPSESVFPNLSETANVFPFYKSGDVDTVQNYRPISIIPSLGKVIAKVFFARHSSVCWTLTI